MLIQPKIWWQLPFVGAMLYHAKIANRCQLCGINSCQTIDKSNKNVNQHWFNQLSFFCADCHDSIAWQRSIFSLQFSQSQVLTGIASNFYTYPYDEIMTKFKNSHDLRQILSLIHAIRQLDVPKNCHPHDSAIVVVPTTKKRLAERGFDPLFWLALHLSFHWQIPIFNQIQREERIHQQGLSREQRLSNVENAFSFISLPNAKNLILFDDVVTTGATLQSLTKSLAKKNKISGYQKKYKLHARAVLHARQ